MYGCVTRVLQSDVEIVLKKIGNEQSGGQIEKSQEISVFKMLSCLISSSNWNHLGRPKDLGQFPIQSAQTLTACG